MKQDKNKNCTKYLTHSHSKQIVSEYFIYYVKKTTVSNLPINNKKSTI